MLGSDLLALLPAYPITPAVLSELCCRVIDGGDLRDKRHRSFISFNIIVSVQAKLHGVGKL